MDDLRRVLATCGEKRYPLVRKILFDTTYTPNLADWIVYIDEKGKVTETLTQNNKALSVPLLRGEKAVYLIAFIEGGLRPKDTPTRKDSIAEAAAPLLKAGIGRAESAALWNYYFAGSVPEATRETRLGDLLKMIIDAHQVDTTGTMLPLIKTAKDSIERRHVLQLLLRQIAKPWDAPEASLRANSDLTMEMREQLTRLVDRFALGELPPFTAPHIPAPSFRVDSLAWSLLGALSAPENRGRLAGIRELIAGPKKKEEEKDSLIFRRDVFQYAKDPFLIRLVTGFGGKILGAGPDLSSPAPDTTATVKIELVDLGPGTGTDSARNLFLAFGRATVSDDIWGRLNLLPPEGKKFPGVHSVLMNFVTTSGSRFGISVGPGYVPKAGTITFTRGDDGRARQIITIDSMAGTADTAFAQKEEIADRAVNIYVYGQFQLLRRRPRPLSRGFGGVRVCESVSLTVGTNLLRGDPLDQVVLGGSLDRLFGSDFSLVAGAVRLGNDEVDRATRKVSRNYLYRLFIGGGFQL